MKQAISFLHYEQLKCDYYGLDYMIENHDITLKIPKGAVAKREKILEVGVAMHGPFIFPENTQPISPILWLHLLEEDVKLNKPIELILPHCYTGSLMTPDQISFALVDHSSSQDVTTYNDGQPHYSFKLWERGTVFYTDQVFGAIKTNLFSHIFCIVKHTKFGCWCQNISFLLSCVDLQPSQTVREFHFYGLFNLATHRKVCQHNWLM